MMKSSSPWLSILIPAYNVAPYVIDCLESIANQYEPGIEVLLLDDCSTDDTLALAQDWISTHQFPVTFITQPQNGGLSAARNRLLDAAQGRYLWFLDSDDVIEPTAIAQLKAIVMQQAPDLILCDYRTWRQEQRFKHKWRGENHMRTFSGPVRRCLGDHQLLFEGIYQKGQLHIWSKISKRELWAKDLRFPEGRVMEDMVVSPRLMLRARTYFYEPSVWVSYRQREGSILATRNQKTLHDMAIANSGVLEVWLKHYPDLSSRARFYFSFFCVKVHLSIVRDLRKQAHGSPVELSVYREQLFTTIGWTKTHLYWQFLKRGWFLRLRRFASQH